MNISSSEFVNRLAEKSGESRKTVAGFNNIGEEPISRALTAKIIHEYIRLIRKEPESPDWQQASELKDLYDCRTCVAHIAECYCKGIMEACAYSTESDVKIFDLKGFITASEADLIIARAVNPQLRIRRENIENKISKAFSLHELSKEKIPKAINLVILCSFEDAVDESIPLPHKNSFDIKFVIRASLSQFMDNPFVRELDLSFPVAFVCASGYMSRLAADMAVSVGYKQVFYGSFTEL